MGIFCKSSVKLPGGVQGSFVLPPLLFPRFGKRNWLVAAGQSAEISRVRPGGVQPPLYHSSAPAISFRHFGHVSAISPWRRPNSLVLPAADIFPRFGKNLADGPSIFCNLSFGGVQSSFVLLPLFFPRCGKSIQLMAGCPPLPARLNRDNGDVLGEQLILADLPWGLAPG